MAAAVADQENALIIFVRNPELGKVKTRLAKGIGEEKALAVYKLLLSHTNEVTAPVNCQKFIFYTDVINPKDIWADQLYQKRNQQGNDLGERMKNAFQLLFAEGFKKTMIVGSDCYQLKTEMMEEAFLQLEENDVVLGPTFDGGYYLLAMKQPVLQIFQNKPWSTSEVTSQTIKDLKDLNLKYFLLEQLHDVDEAEDLELNGIEI